MDHLPFTQLGKTFCKSKDTINNKKSVNHYVINTKLELSGTDDRAPSAGGWLGPTRWWVLVGRGWWLVLCWWMLVNGGGWDPPGGG